MRLLIVLVICLPASCASDSGDGGGSTVGDQAEAWTWERWSRAMLGGAATADLPPIPSEGWRQDAERSWSRFGAQVADFDADGRIDYLRIVDPPGSYNHRVWSDHDRDGYLDHEGHRHDTVRVNERFPVPLFEPANNQAPAEADSQER